MDRSSRTGAARWWIFNAVGAVGLVVQLACLWALRDGLGLHYIVAAAGAIELTILHNFVWHARWTWSDRRAATGGVVCRLVRFNLAAATTATSNLALMAVLIEVGHLHYLVANIVAVVACGLVTFLLSDTVVFQPDSRMRRT